MKTGKVAQRNGEPATTTPRRIALELRHDRDGRYRWYEQETDADTEVSATTPAQAWQDAAHVWGADVWNFERVSDTTVAINADDARGSFYTLGRDEHAAWYTSGPEHDNLHNRLRDSLPPGTEVYDADGIVVDVIPLCGGGRADA